MKIRNIVAILVFTIFSFLIIGCSEQENPVLRADQALQNNHDPSIFGDDLATKSYTAALHTANWLESQVILDESGNFYWPKFKNSTESSLGISSGNAGIGLFFLELYRVTGQSHHLDFAIKAANRIISLLPRSELISHDWLDGHAGQGELLLELFKETRDFAYLEAAERIGDALVENKIAASRGGYYWKHRLDNGKIYLGIAHGNGGAGKFLSHLYLYKEKTEYLEALNGAFEWLESFKMQVGPNALAWNRLESDSHVYHGWCSGAAGLIPFIKTMESISGNEEFDNTLKQIGNGLVIEARQQTNGVAWYRDMDNGKSFYTTYCQGAPGLISSLMALHSYYENENYLAVAEQGLEWLISVAKVHENGGWFWEASGSYNIRPVGFMMGVAGIGYVFAEAYEKTNKPEYLEAIENSTELLLRIANRPSDDQLSWYYEVNKTTNSDDDYNKIATGYWGGAAGIGLYWLKVYQAVSK